MGILALLGLIATLSIRPELLDNYRTYPIGVLFPVALAAGMIAMFYFQARRNDKAAFLSSAACICVMLGGAAFALYPVLLPASTDPSYSLTVHNSAASAYGLRVGIVWWILGMILAVSYFAYLFRFFRGKVTPSTEGY